MGLLRLTTLGEDGGDSACGPIQALFSSRQKKDSACGCVAHSLGSDHCFREAIHTKPN